MTPEQWAAVFRAGAERASHPLRTALFAMADKAESFAENTEIGINPSQHCTSTKCMYTQSHTASWCGTEQMSFCSCPFCYPF